MVTLSLPVPGSPSSCMCSRGCPDRSDEGNCVGSTKVKDLVRQNVRLSFGMMDSTGVDFGGQRRTETGTEARSSHVQYRMRHLVRSELRSIDTSMEMYSVCSTPHEGAGQTDEGHLMIGPTLSQGYL